MLDFKKIKDWGYFLKALGLFNILIALIWIVSFALTHNRYQALLYWRSYSTLSGDMLASKICRYYLSPKPACFFIGLSSVFEGLNEQIFKQHRSDYNFLNVGMGGATIYKIELAVSILEEYNVKPNVIVVGLHPNLLKDSSLMLWSAGFLDIMGLKTQKTFILREKPEGVLSALLQAQYRLIWPGLRLSQQLSRIIREKLFLIQSFVRGNNRLPGIAFEKFRNELVPWMTNRTRPERLSTEERDTIISEMEKKGYFLSETYAQPRHIESMRYLLSLCIHLSPHVVILVMPETSYAREKLSIYPRERFWRIVNEFQAKGCKVLDKSDRFPDDSFDFLFHLLPEASQELSNEIYREIEDMLAN